MKLYTVMIGYTPEGATEEKRETHFVVSPFLTEASEETVSKLFRLKKIKSYKEVTALHVFPGAPSFPDDATKQAKKLLRLYASAATSKNRPYQWDSPGLVDSRNWSEKTKAEIETLQRLAGVRK